VQAKRQACDRDGQRAEPRGNPAEDYCREDVPGQAGGRV